MHSKSSDKMKAYVSRLRRRENRVAKNKRLRNKGVGRESSQFKSGGENPNAKLTNEQVLHIYNGQERPSDLIKIYDGLTYSRISDIRSGGSWSWLTGHVKEEDDS